jgi:hypothetical protein
MIRVRIQIGDGDVYDTFDKYGFIYISSDNRFAAPTKDKEVTTYVDQNGENRSNKTVLDAFDYTIVFVVLSKDGQVNSAKRMVQDFNKLLYTEDENGIKIFKTVTFYQDYKGDKIVGIPDIISEPKETYTARDEHYQGVQVEFKLRVSDPTKCSFSE